MCHEFQLNEYLLYFPDYTKGSVRVDVSILVFWYAKKNVLTHQILSTRRELDNNNIQRLRRSYEALEALWWTYNENNYPKPQ